MIIASNIQKFYGDRIVIDNVSITIPAGGVTSIIGPNGAGKSTLLSIIARLMPMDRGTVTIDGLDVVKTPDNILARRLSILRQDNHVSARLTVHDLVTFGRYPYSKGRPTADDKKYIDQALAYLKLEPLANRFLDELSGGQRQRAFVAMVLCQNTDYVLLDEPLNNLDMKHASGMMQILRKAADELNKTVVLVLHDINFASWYSDRIIAMKEGKLCHSGTVEEIIRPDILREIYDMNIAVQDIDGRRISLFYE
jgi:iron complex transport system ATP-binding protein